MNVEMTWEGILRKRRLNIHFRVISLNFCILTAIRMGAVKVSILACTQR